MFLPFRGRKDERNAAGKYEVNLEKISDSGAYEIEDNSVLEEAGAFREF